MKDKDFYIQNGYIGNAICWWRPNAAGYTSNINEAGKYSEQEAKKQANMRPEDVAWPCIYIDNALAAHKTIIDADRLDHKKCHRGRKKY